MTDLGFFSTIPVVGYVARRGACGRCGGAIDPSHVAGELAGALALTVPVLCLGPMRGGLVAVLALLALASSIVDLRTRRLPDVLTAGIGAASAALALSHGSAALAAGAIAGLLTLIVLELLRFAFRRLRGHEGLGFGDVKLLAALAIWLGPSIPWALAAAAVIGLLHGALHKPADGRLAFGPCILIAGLAVGMAREVGSWP
jgi:leader peptidase (prepilin peptidase)/N-methyltransferase